MVNWQVTGATIYCGDVDDEVTLLVYKDRTVECTGYKKYGEPDKDTINLLKKRGSQLKQQLQCVGPECHRVIQYRDKLFSREAKEGRSE